MQRVRVPLWVNYSGGRVHQNLTIRSIAESAGVCSEGDFERPVSRRAVSGRQNVLVVDESAATEVAVVHRNGHLPVDIQVILLNVNL